jgi:hypothetical protein
MHAIYNLPIPRQLLNSGADLDVGAYVGADADASDAEMLMRMLML